MPTTLSNVRANRPFKYRVCATCQRDNWYLASEEPPRVCGLCADPFDYEDRTPVVKRYARYGFWLLAGIFVAVLILHAVR